MNDSFGGEFVATQTVQGGAASEQKAEGIAPVLIRQVLESPEGNFQMWGMTFGMVSTAAIVRNIESSSTKITYSLEDHTGHIEAHYWLEEGDTTKSPDVMLNNYAKVYGSVRSQGGQKTLMVFKMLPISDPNEVCTHILEALNARYHSESFSKTGADGINEFGQNPQTSESSYNTMGLNSKQLAILDAIKNDLSDEGISRSQLQQKFKQIKESEINGILDFMISEGHIYSSVDSNHFRSTE